MVLIIRFLISFLILVLLFTYLIIPAVSYIVRAFKSEAKRIDKSLAKNTEKKDDGNER